MIGSSFIDLVALHDNLACLLPDGFRVTDCCRSETQNYGKESHQSSPIFSVLPQYTWLRSKDRPDIDIRIHCISTISAQGIKGHGNHPCLQCDIKDFTIPTLENEVGDRVQTQLQKC